MPLQDPGVEPDPVLEDIPEFECEACGSMHHDEDDADTCCAHYCPSCDSRWTNEEDAMNCCRYTCEECGNSFDSQRGASRCCGDDSESTDTDTSTDFHLLSLDGPRVPRYISVEQEISHGMDQVQRLWGDEGWSYDEIKGDGSLAEDGVEIEYSMLNLYGADSEEFSKKLAGVRKLRNSGEIRTGSRAGTHIHVSAHDIEGKRITPRDMASIYGAFQHCEGAIYRIAACGWKRHRREEASTDYAQILRKKEGVKPKDLPGLQNPSERYYGVSYGRILSAIDYCRCGAVKMGDWADCNCGQWEEATFEWRVFNSSTRPKTIHAWIILALGLTEHAIRHDCSNLPIHGYDTYVNEESLRKQVAFILDFPMSKKEREVLLDAISMSPDLKNL